jgi:hypothetical protein
MRNLGFWGYSPIGERVKGVEDFSGFDGQNRTTAMKYHQYLFLGAALACFHESGVPADDLFQLFWRGTYYARNSTSHIIAVSFTEQSLVEQVAQNSGLDASQLIFVYRPQKRDAAVVQKNGAFVATVFQMQSTFTDINNPNNSITVRQALLSNPANANISGSFFGLEQRTLSAAGGLSSDSLTGMAVYSNSDGNLVYSAHVSTGSRVADMTNAP